jgi:hypothetical protein
MIELKQFPLTWRNVYSRLWVDNINNVIVPFSGQFGTWQGTLFGLLGQDAVTLKGHIHLTPRLLHDDQHRKFEVLAHESVHVWQQKQEKFWWWWVFKYFVGSKLEQQAKEFHLMVREGVRNVERNG